MAKKAKKFRLEERSRYGRGILSVVVSAVSVVTFLSVAFISMVMAGRAPQWIGILGFAGFLAGFYGMVAGLESFRERNQSYALSRVGTLMGGFMVALWFIVFCAGMAQ